MRSMLPVQAEPYFRSHLIRPKNAAIEFAPGFAILLVTKGKGIINGKKIKKGDIVVINQGEINDLIAKTKKFTAVGVKIPAGGNDKVRI